MHPISDILFNRHLGVALLALVIAQWLKVAWEFWRTGKFNRAVLFSTGSMPSSHTSMVMALMVSIGLGEGFGTAMFALSGVLALITMHDAQGVRRAAGKQAEAINFLFSKFEDQGIKLDKKLKEVLGHRPIEVIAGAVLGILIAFISYWMFPVSL